MHPIRPDHPSGPALLDAARRALLDELAPALGGRQRFVVLMAANALGIAMREIEEADATARAWDRALAAVADAAGAPLAALATAIRTGREDGNSELYQALLATTDVAARIYKQAPPAKT